MKERELQLVLEHKDAPMGWPVVIYYEYDGGIQVNGVWDDHEDGDTDYWGELTKEQEDAVTQECIDDYSGLCDAAQAAAEDAQDFRDDR